MLRKFIEIDLIGEKDGYYDTRYTTFDSIGNDYPGYIALNTNCISIAEEIWGIPEFYKMEAESLDTEDALDKYYSHLFTKVTMENGEVVNIQETLDELVESRRE